MVFRLKYMGNTQLWMCAQNIISIPQAFVKIFHSRQKRLANITTDDGHAGAMMNAYD